jgi:hypothetical protein
MTPPSDSPSNYSIEMGACLVWNNNGVLRARATPRFKKKEPVNRRANISQWQQVFCLDRQLHEMRNQCHKQIGESIVVVE